MPRITQGCTCRDSPVGLLATARLEVAVLHQPELNWPLLHGDSVQLQSDMPKIQSQKHMCFEVLLLVGTKAKLPL